MAREKNTWITQQTNDDVRSFVFYVYQRVYPNQIHSNPIIPAKTSQKNKKQILYNPT